LTYVSFQQVYKFLKPYATIGKWAMGILNCLIWIFNTITGMTVPYVQDFVWDFDSEGAHEDGEIDTAPLTVPAPITSNGLQMKLR
jgi:hypothetical protein